MSLTGHIFGMNRSSGRTTLLGRLWQQLAIATNWPVLVSVAVLCLLGVCSIWADAPSDARKQLIFIAAGTACLVAFQAMNYQRIGRFAWGFYLLAVALIVYTVMPGVPRSGFGGVPVINGAHPWIKFGSFSLQPAELMKIGFVMVLARYLRYRSNYRTLKGLTAPFALALVPVALIMKQPDLGTALTFIPALFAMLYVAGAKLWHLAAVVGMGVAVAPVMWLAGPEPDGPGLPGFKYLPAMVKSYQRERVYAMFSDDAKTLREKGFQQKHALIAFGSGGVTGKGVGDIEVGRHVPEAHNDMIFALIGEQFGLFGAAAVLGAYAVLFAAGIEIAGSTKEPFGRLLAVGVVSLLAGQTFLNIMVTLKLMPVTGVTLPFVSYGGSSLLASFMAAGLLLNIGQNRPFVIARDSFEY
ncbi:MAG TPA: FtsW/RodA/SpoVE family cell cycle protein [Tepidisphaeraceae bacterium]|nr:FtsW/RodA/SpoVE family cell cycle protein [Tepidisphaeraceae bacterium]